MNRATSVYHVDFPFANSDAQLTEILENLADVFDPAGKYDGPGDAPLSGELAGSGVNGDRYHTPFVRIRVANDDVARAVAQEIAGDLEFSIRTGVGVNQRWLD